MSEPNSGEKESGEKGESPVYHQELQHSQASARVPERVGRGIFTTGAIVMNGPHDFVIDFLMSLVPPQRVAVRVVLAPTVVPLFIAALNDNIAKYQQNYGPIPRLPPPPPGVTPPPITDLYDRLKLPDDELSGVYANTVLIVHNVSEFCFDFITSFFPRSAVSARIFMAAPHVSQLLDSLVQSMNQYRRKFQPPVPMPPLSATQPPAIPPDAAPKSRQEPPTEESGPASGES